jgi:UDP-N-acetylmuramate--alanine ligase
MSKGIDFGGRPFHFLGIGGIGMSALAYVLAKRQIPVFGSDLKRNNIIERLESVGVTVFNGQTASNIDSFQDQLPQVICSTAINKSNPELAAALAKGCDIWHRSDVLAALIAEYHSIAVAGTHGKTTTSSMVGCILVEAGLDPTIIIGGEVSTWEGNARTGATNYLVAEADESDGSLTKHKPQIGIITNIELDHTDHYGSLEAVIQTFQTFASNCKTLIGSLDCPLVSEKIKPAISYGIHPDSTADYTVKEVVYGSHSTKAQVYERGVLLGRLELEVLGEHNLSNALGAVAAARFLNVDFAPIAAGLLTFGGAKRRFELRGLHGNISFVDDYAHHPSEIAVTLTSAKLRIQAPNRVIASFQPHRYSRTLTFLAGFAESLAAADLVVITDIYSAGETNDGRVSSEQLVEEIRKINPQVVYKATLPEVTEYLNQTLQAGDMALFLGAGNLNQIIPDVMAFYQT